MTAFVRHHPPVEGDRLDSWKEIAEHVGRSVRTVRRWEVEEGMPVHRHMHRSAGTVYAYRSEIDAWMRRHEASGATEPSSDREPSPASVSPPALTSTPTARDRRERSVAVLPFAYVGPDAGSAYLADGFTDEIIGELSKVRSLRVLSRTSSMILKGTQKDARALGRDLGVGHLLEGTVRHHRDQVRVSIRLLDPEADDRLWAESFEGRLDDVFAIQEAIARKTVDALQVHLSDDESRRLGERAVENVVAWQYLLQARQAALRWRKDSIDHAVQLLRGAIELAGDSPALLVALGRAHLHYRESGVDLSDGPLREAKALAHAVLSRDPSSGVGRQLQGWIRYAEGDIQGAVVELRAAVEVDRTDPDSLSLLANCLLISGQSEASAGIIERLLAVDPLTPLSRCLPGYRAALDGDFERAVGPYREMFELDQGNPMGRLFYAFTLANAGRADEARAIADVPSADRMGPAGEILGVLRASLAPVEERPPADPDAPPWRLSPMTEGAASAIEMFARFLAEAYARAGLADVALGWLEVAVSRGFTAFPYLRRNAPALRRLDGHPRFEAMLQDVERRWRAFAPG